MEPSRRTGSRQRLGQHFLKGERTLARIADAVGGSPGEWVVEIGSGRGALTRPLLERGLRLLAVEVDSRLSRDLETALSGKALAVLNADARSADVGAALRSLGAPLPVVLAGNLPYESATPMVRAFVRRPDLYSRIVVMLQKEVALRLVADPRGENYGFLSLDVGAHAAARRLFDVAPGEFSPPPRVVSTVVELLPRPAAPGTAAALAVASRGFATRRKTLLNSLSSGWEREAVSQALAAEGLLVTSRAEELHLRTFFSLAARLGPAR